MKIRKGFVSNSSSSSFIIQSKDLTRDQIEGLLAYKTTAEQHCCTEWLDDYWNVWETETSVKGFTHMDNFDMGRVMEVLEIPASVVKWDEENENLFF